MRASAAILLFALAIGAASAALLDRQSTSRVLKRLSASTRARMASRGLQPTHFEHMATSPLDLTQSVGVPLCDWKMMDAELANFANAGTEKERFDKECLKLAGSFAHKKEKPSDPDTVQVGESLRNLKEHVEWAPLRALCIYSTFAYRQWNPPLWENTAAKPMKFGAQANVGPNDKRTNFAALTICAVNGIHALRRAQQTYAADPAFDANVKRDFFLEKVDAAHKRDMTDPVLFHGSTMWSAAHVGGQYRNAFGNGNGPRVVTEKALFSSSRSSAEATTWAFDEKSQGADGGVVAFISDNTAWIAPWSKKVGEDEYLSPPGTELVVLDIIKNEPGNGRRLGCADRADFKAEFILAVERRRFARMCKLHQHNAAISMNDLLDQSAFVPLPPVPAAAVASPAAAAAALAAATVHQLTADKNYAASALPANPAVFNALRDLLRPRFIGAICAQAVSGQRSKDKVWVGDNGASNAAQELARPEHVTSHLNTYLQDISTYGHGDVKHNL